MREASAPLLERLLDEKNHGIHGGIYHKIQVDLAYNSNHIEGSRLSHDQTRYIFETHSLYGDNILVDDVIETANHFRCLDYLLDHIKEPINSDTVKTLHRILKTGTFSSQSREAVIGDYKKYPNYVGDMRTSPPNRVEQDMDALLSKFSRQKPVTLDALLDFHAQFEKIHPFYDGNGRIGRLLLFQQCLAYDLVPFIIRDDNRIFYYRGLKEWQAQNGEHGYLRDTCLLEQDNMKRVLDYFEIPYEAEEQKEKPEDWTESR